MTLEELWQKKSDQELELATRQIAEYTEYAQQIIRAEAVKRGTIESPAFVRSTTQRDPNLLGNLLERSRIGGFGAADSSDFFRQSITAIEKIAALILVSLSVAFLIVVGRLILAFLLAASCLYGVYRAITYRNSYLLLYELGVVYEQPNEKRVAYYDELVVWQAITQLRYFFMPIGKITEEYTLQFPDGEQINTFQELIGKKLQMMVTQHQLPNAIETYNQVGNVLINSNISLNKNGISVNGETLAWSNINYVDVIQGKICIYKIGNRFAAINILMSVVPNVYVLLNLLEHLGYYKPKAL
jgi:hypothetical protein